MQGGAAHTIPAGPGGSGKRSLPMALQSVQETPLYGLLLHKGREGDIVDPDRVLAG